MAQREFKNLIRKLPWHANMTELNHLGAALLAKPDVFESKVTKAFAAYDYANAPLYYKLRSEGRERTTTSNEWTWGLDAAVRRPLVSLDDPNTGNSTPGKFNQPFKLWLDENWYKAGDILTPGDSGKVFQVRVQRDPIERGRGFLYTVVMNSGNADLFMPEKYLKAGAQWSKLNSQYEEGAEQAGSTQYTLPIELSSRLSRFRKTYRVTGDAHDEILSIPIADANGVYRKMWMKYAEAQFQTQWYQEKENAIWYNRSTDGKVIGSTNRAVLSGPGIHELIEDGGHRETYNRLTGKLLKDYLLSIFFNRVGPKSGKRKLVGYTGEVGMLAFHEATQKDASGSGFIQVVDNKFMESTSSDYHSNALAYGYQFTKYRMANNIEIEMVHNPLYDRLDLHHGDIDERTGFPKESSRITFLDFSGEGKDSNIQLVKKENAFSRIYVHGTASPYGRPKDRSAAHSGDYYDVVIQDQCGVHIEDTTRTGELILQ